MTNPAPDPLTLDQIATAAAGVIADARAARLTAPFTLSCHDYGPPAVILYLYDDSSDTAAIWAALGAWAARYGTEVTSRPSSSPGSTYASAKFLRDGILYEVSAIIRPAPEADQDDYAQDEAA
jgi:hypothetical protein